MADEECSKTGSSERQQSPAHGRAFTPIRDNRSRGSAGPFLAERISAGAELSFVSAYFTIFAYGVLKAQLDGIARLRFLFGEPAFVGAMDPSGRPAQAFVIDRDGMQLAQYLEQKAVARQCADWIRRKAEIRSMRHGRLMHGKLYHIAAESTHALVGSSNFTVCGLGLGARSNVELNIAIEDVQQCADLLAWFDEFWHDESETRDVKEEVLEYLAEVYADQAPEFVYYKTLFHVFEQMLEQEQRGFWPAAEPKQLTESGIWKALFTFQKDGVRGAINRILKHNGCILADSVGLGKTYEALAVIKYFELRNDKVLVLCPKKLRDNWTVYQAATNSLLNPFPEDRFGYTVLCHTDLSRTSGMSGDVNLRNLNWSNYDLVVIDESHNFRNNTRSAVGPDGQPVRVSRYERLMDDILKAGVRTNVLLLSATPVNNDLLDLRNQLRLITHGDDHAFADTMGVANLTETLKVAQRAFSAWAKEHQGRRKDVGTLMDRLSAAFFKLLDELTIARSREHIRRYYAATLAELGPFPDRPRPVTLTCPTDTQGDFQSYDEINEMIGRYELNLFRPSKYVRPEARDRYKSKVQNFTQADREKFLIAMMKVNFLKRLESSVSSFALTMRRTVEKMERLERKINDYLELRDRQPELPLFEMDPDDMDEETQDALAVGGKLKINLADLRVADWLTDLQADRERLRVLADQASLVTPDRDAKLAALKQTISERVLQPVPDRAGRPNRKVLVFTAFADTAEYLYENLRDWARRDLGVDIALVSGGAMGNRTTYGSNEYSAILTNFSPASKQRDRLPSLPQDREIDILIATDCISEGQNLQDCGLLVNYDIHWNPVRIIQRFGRIDRIGSLHTAVQMVNFWPTDDLNKYINLRDRVEARMALVDLAATGQDDVLNVPDVEAVVRAEMTYRDQQLLRLRDEVLDLEEVTESVTLNEFTLDDFRMDLMRYLEANREKLQKAPMGIYSVVPAESEGTVIRPGIVFCLRQRTEAAGPTPNPLAPYFLVYVRDDGQVRYGFTHPKQVLDILRATCYGRTTPEKELCDLFDRSTRDGADMSRCTSLVEAATDSIVAGFGRKSLADLMGARRGRLPERSGQPSSLADFELVTWFVIAGEQPPGAD